MTQDKLGPMHSFPLNGVPYQIAQRSDGESCTPECPLTPAQHQALRLATGFVSTFLTQRIGGQLLPLEQLVLAAMDFAIDAMHVDPAWCIRFRRLTLEADADDDTLAASRHLIEQTPLPEEAELQ